MSKLISIAVGVAFVLGGIGAAAQEPGYQVTGFAITPHQVGVLGGVLRPGEVREQSPAATLASEGMPASPHQVAVLTPQPTAGEQQIAQRRIAH